MLRFFYFLVFLITTLDYGVYAQFDIEHYIPPLYSRTDDPTICGAHYLALSTEIDESFYVSIFEGNIFIDSVKISKKHSYKYNLGYGYSAIGIISSKKLNKPLIREGVHLKAKYPFFAKLSHRAKNQGGSLTSKGTLALGHSFRTGHLLNYDEKNNCSSCANFISVMAIENQTNVLVSEIAQDIHFFNAERMKRKEGKKFTQFKLDKGESYVLAVHSDDLYGDINSLIGTKVTSDKPIALNSGSWLARAPNSTIDFDIGIDQAVPENVLGDEYLLVKGEGVNKMEKPLIIGTKDNTGVLINGVFNRYIGAGECLELSGEDFSDDYLFIQTSKEVFVYQNTSGSEGVMTSGLNVVPPLSSCSNNNNIRVSDMKLIADSAVLQVVARSGKQVKITDVDRNEVFLLDGGKEVVIEGGIKVPWVIYKFNIPSYINDVLVTSTGTINVGLNYHSNYLGAASYLSGFAKGPVIKNSSNIKSLRLGDSIGVSLLNNEGYYKFNWYRNGVQVASTTDSEFVINKPGKYFVGAYLVNNRACPDEIFSNEIEINEFKNPQKDEGINEESQSLSRFVRVIYFERDNYELNKLKEGYLRKIIDSLNVTKETKYLEIVGHSDCLGTDEYNYSLSKNRAEKVKSVLEQYGLENVRYILKAEGNKRSITNCKCDDCIEIDHVGNRRVEIRLLEK